MAHLVSQPKTGTAPGTITDNDLRNSWPSTAARELAGRTVADTRRGRGGSGSGNMADIADKEAGTMEGVRKEI